MAESNKLPTCQDVGRLPDLIILQLKNWDAKYDNTLVESRLICCFTSVSTADIDYWADYTITDLFCEIADVLLEDDVA